MTTLELKILRLSLQKFWEIYAANNCKTNSLGIANCNSCEHKKLCDSVDLLKKEVDIQISNKSYFDESEGF